ncbi:aminopeptidase P family protein [uncultured Bacteroides sp.]|uniref:aminopeptidase P family protein n=1 Tax=uncultured Bacteroides sp. TaxID=162156 RepID=UPI0025D9FCEE|nr:aminopeptidase P family protein [uncultured Bacteroides sp.]
MKTEIRKRISALRSLMQSKSISAYITYSTDPHFGEYVPAHWESRKWITGFTGSAGTAVITPDDGGLWIDSRYFIQAEEQLTDTGLKLFKERIPETPSIPQWLCSVLKKGERVGIDGYTTPLQTVNELRNELSAYGIEVVMIEDPYKTIWNDRPGLPSNKPFILEEKYSGESASSKISTIRNHISNTGTDYILISALDEIAWTLNMRGTDIECNPLFVSYLLISEKEATLYINKNKLTETTIDYLQSQGVGHRNYEDIESDLTAISGRKITMSPSINFAMYNAASEHNTVFIQASPVSKYKAVKNQTEINGFRNAMLRDGVAMVRFLIWLQKNIGNGNLTELSIDEQLYKERSAMENFRGISFATIAGYQEHGAIVHYEADEHSASTLKPEGLLLIDSGAQYLDGTTDITRTIPLGPTTEEQKKDYTLVLKGFIQLAMAEFPQGTCGTQLDVLARLAMWKEGINYGHGTGHGVGHFLNVHEGPHQIRMNNVPTPLQPGMTVTNEPGIYRAGKYGIRTENTMLTVPSRKTDFGEFYKFEQLTLCPINTETILWDMLSPEETNWLKEYHETVYSKLSPLLTDEEKQWLRNATNPQ